jgi:hypothetical protein
MVRLIDRFVRCLTDGRAAELVEHSVATMAGHRLYSSASRASRPEALRPSQDQPRSGRHDRLFVDLFLETHQQPPERITIAMETTIFAPSALPAIRRRLLVAGWMRLYQPEGAA